MLLYNMILKKLISKLTQIKTLHFSILLSSVFLLFALLNILNHEMWRDELQAWLLGRDSETILDLFRNLKYEGHPILWHLGLFFIGKLTHNPLFMQIYHILIATGVVFLFARYSPFTRFQKVLFSFGYYPLYEYAAISRNYSIGLLLIFAFCTIYMSNRTNKFIYLAIVLFFLAHTNIYGLILTICLFWYFLIDTFLDMQKKKWDSKKKIHLILTILIVFIGILTSVIQIIPPPDTGYAVGWHTNWDQDRFLSVAESVYKAFVPVPVNELHFWNTNIINSQSISILLSVLILIISIILFVRTPMVLMLFLSGTGGLLLFMYSKYIGFPRHQGHLFILFIASIWLAGKTKFNLKLFRTKFLTKGLTAIKYIFVTLLLVTNMYAGILSSYLDSKYTFSMGMMAAKYINDNQLNKKPLAGHRDYAVVSVAGYLEKQIYYPRGNRIGSFIIYNNKRTPFGNKRALRLIKRHSKDKWKDTVLIFNSKPKKKILRVIKIIESFEGSIVQNENFYICKPRPSSSNF